MRLDFVREKETKNTVRYQAVDEAAAVRTVYLQKTADARLLHAERLTLTLEVADVVTPLRQAA